MLENCAMRKLLKSLLLFCLTISYTTNIQANDPEKSNFPFLVETFFTQNGLPQNQVSSAVASPNGLIYLSTMKGIVTFDGKQFKLLDENRSVEQNPYEKLVLSPHNNHLYGINGHQKIYQLLPSFSLKVTAKQAVFDGKNILYLTTDGRFFQFNTQNGRSVYIFQTKLKGNVKFTVANGVIHYSNDTSSYAYSLAKKTSTKTNFVVDHYFTSNHKIIGIKGNQIIDFPSRTTLYTWSHPTTIYDFYFDPQLQTYHIASASGYLVHREKPVLYRSENGLPTSVIRSILPIPAEGIIYLGTGQRGLLKLQTKYTNQQPNIRDNNENSLTSVVHYRGAIYYAGSRNRIYRLQNGKATIQHIAKHPVSGMNVISDTLVVGTWGSGMYLYKDKHLIDSVKPLRGNLSVHGIFQASNRSVWIGTNRGVLFGSSLKKLRPIHLNRRIITFLERKNGTVCAGGSEGVVIFDRFGRLLQKIGRKDGLQAIEVRSMYEDSRGRLWIGTSGGGLYCYHDKQLTSINGKKNCFLNEDVFTLAPDDQGFLWMTSNQGLYAVHQRALHYFLTNQIDYLVPYVYTEKHGLYNPEFNGGCYPNYARDINGVFYFPTIEGLCVFKTTPVRLNQPMGFFKHLIINNKDTLQSKKIELKPGDYSLRFEFDVPAHNTSRRVYLQHGIQKNGSEILWNEPTTRSNLQFSSLSHGDYTIHVRFFDAQNQRNPSVHKFQIEIYPRVYESKFFYVLLSIICIIITITILFLQLEAKRRKYEEKNRIETELLRLKLASIHSRMNPHFIFNTLSGIKYALSAHKWDDAEKLTDRFSVFLREFLSYSENSMVTIQQEADLLIKYLEIEKQRFSEELETTVIVDEQIKYKSIPNMLLLPLVENAVSHGIVHSDRKGKISIEFRWNRDKIVIFVRDNGIGFEQAKRINAHRSNHQSKGLKLLRKKLQKLKLHSGILIDLETESSDEGSVIQLIIHV